MAFYTKQDFLFHIDRYHFNGPSSSESQEPRFRLLEIEANAVITYVQNSQMNLASGAGSPVWSRTRPKLVCCEACWLPSNNNFLVNCNIFVSKQTVVEELLSFQRQTPKLYFCLWLNLFLFHKRNRNHSN